MQGEVDFTITTSSSIEIRVDWIQVAHLGGYDLRYFSDEL